MAISAWAIAIWYSGGDIYTLFTSEDHGIVKVMAHVTGGISGYLCGLIFLRSVRWETRILQQESDRQAVRAKIA